MYNIATILQFITIVGFLGVIYLLFRHIDKLSMYIMAQNNKEAFGLSAKNSATVKIDKKKAEKEKLIEDYLDIVKTGVCDDEDIKRFREDGVIQ